MIVTVHGLMDSRFRVSKELQKKSNAELLNPEPVNSSP
jgi:hypothetical protein